MTRYKIMKNMENEQEKEKNYFELFYPLTIEVWTLNFMICALALKFWTFPTMIIVITDF